MPEPTPAAPPAAVDTSLADAVAAQSQHVAALLSGTAAAPAAPPEPVAAPPAKTEVPAQAPDAPAAVAPPPAEKAEDPKPADKPPEVDEAKAADERAKALAEYVRGKRFVRAETARLKAERAALDAAKAEAAKMREDAAKVLALREKAAKDPVGAVEELLGKDRFGNEFMLAALERVSNGTARELTQEERDAVVAEAAAMKVRSELEAAEKAREEQRKTEAQRTQEEGQARYLDVLGKQLTASADKYPLLASEGWDKPQEIIAAVDAHHKATGGWPTHDQVLQHFESKLKEQTERRYGLLNKSKPASPLTSPAAAPVATPQDTRARPATPPDDTDFEARRDALIARLNGRVVG